MLTSLVLNSTKTRADGIIEIGLNESIPATVNVAGSDMGSDKIIFELRKEQRETTATIASIAGNVLMLTADSLLVPNKHRNAWVNLDISLSERKLLKVRTNTERTITFSPAVNLADFTAVGRQIKITNIVKWVEVPIVIGTGGTTGSATTELAFSASDDSLRTSKSAGIYTLRAFWTGNETTEDSKEIEVAIVSVWQIRQVFMAGIDLTVPNPAYYTNPTPTTPEFISVLQNDDLLHNGIRAAISEFEAATQIYLDPKIVITNPGPNEVCDIAISGIDYWGQDKHLMIKLPHHHIISIQKVEGFHGAQKIFTWNPGWYEQSVKKRIGMIQMIPRVGGMPYTQTDLGMLDFVTTFTMADEIPGFWHVDYTIGWDESIQPIPMVFWQVIGQAACVLIAGILGDALSPGIASSSVSMDGLSESKSTTASAMYNLFSAKINQFQKENERLMKLIFDNFVPLAMAVV